MNNEAYYREVLRRIAKEYMSPKQLKKKSEKMYGLDYESALEMSYENIQGEASHALKAVRMPKRKPSEENKP